MPQLPTFNVNDQAKYDRAMAAFGNETNYLKWLRQQIIDEVSRVEAKKIIDQRDSEAENKRVESRNYFNNM